MYKLINENGTLHSFHTGSFYGHSVQECTNAGTAEFSNGEMNTDKYRFELFHYIPMFPGDFITRKGTKGIMLFEVQSCRTKRDESKDFGWPNDYYVVNTIWCGYFSNETGQRTIFNGYGINPPKPKLTRKNAAFLGTFLALALFFVLFILIPILQALFGG